MMKTLMIRNMMSVLLMMMKIITTKNTKLVMLIRMVMMMMTMPMTKSRCGTSSAGGLTTSSPLSVPSSSSHSLESKETETKQS